MVLPVHNGAKETEYAIDLLGFGLEPAEDISLYTSEELAMGEWIALKGLVLDYFLPLLTNIAGALADDAPLEGYLGGNFTAELSTYLQFIALEIPAFHGALSNGDWWGAVLSLINSAWVSGEFQEMTTSLMVTALSSSSMSNTQVLEVTGAVKSFMSSVGIVDIIGGLVDNIISGVHFQECQEANTWEVTVTSPVIHIEPREATIETHHNQLLTCVLDDDTGGPPTGVAYAYRWSCAGETGILINPAHPADASNDFLTSYDYVQYQADRGVAGVEDVKCAVYYKAGPDTTFIAEDTMTLTVTKREIALQDTLLLCGEGEITLTPTITPQYTNDEVVVWAWRSNGTAGQLSGPGGQTGSWDLEANPSATYMGNSSGGTDQLLCIASLDIDGTISPVDTAVVFVEVGEQEMFPGELYGSTYYFPEESTCGHNVYVRFSKVGGATHYTVYGYNYVDFWHDYFGTSFTRSGPPWPPRSYETDSEVFVWMTGGGGSGGWCTGPDVEGLEWSMSRFAGAIIEVTPNCP